MADLSNSDKEFLEKLHQIVNENIANESFGVSELAKDLGMSRSSLHRKVNALTKVSVSQYINQERLKSGRDLLRKTSLTVSEVSFKVGFKSKSYFIKCFHDFYGYPPGEVGKRDTGESEPKPQVPAPATKKRSSVLLISAALVLIIAVVLFFVVKPFSFQQNREISIAVLPLANLTGHADNVDITDAIQDAIITELGKLGNHRVISRTSTLRFRKHEMLLKDIAKQLGVNTIVEGSVTKAEDELGINIQLIDVFPKERHLFANDYHDNIKNVLRIQSAAVKDIAKEINIKLTKEDEQRLDDAPVVDPEIYRAYVRAMYNLNRGTHEAIEEGIRILNETLEKDPADPFINAALALGYATMGHGQLDAAEAFQMAESAANKAIQIDPTIDNAYYALAMLYLYQSWDWPKAKVAFENAVIANPSNAVAHAHFAWYLILFDEKEKAIYHAEQAAKLDPLYPSYKAWVSLICSYFEEYDDAEIWAKKALKLNDNIAYANGTMGLVHLRKKEYQQAFEYFEKLPKNASGNATRVYGYVKTGQRGKAMEIWNETQEKAKNRNVNLWHMASMAATLGFTDKAFELLNEAVDKRVYPVTYTKTNYVFNESLGKDPRFNELLKRMNIPPKKEISTSL